MYRSQRPSRVDRANTSCGGDRRSTKQSSVNINYGTGRGCWRLSRGSGGSIVLFCGIHRKREGGEQ